VWVLSDVDKNISLLNVKNIKMLLSKIHTADIKLHRIRGTAILEDCFWGGEKNPRFFFNVFKDNLAK
jgi:hypothetical protein